MRRRRFLQASGAAALGAAAGCLGSSSPPPRKSNALSDVAIQSETDTPRIRVDLADDPWVVSRYDADAQSDRRPPASLAVDLRSTLAGLSPVGVASAKGRSGGGGGRGATGRGTGGYSSAPRSHNGYAWYHAHDDDDEWYESHADDVTKYAAAIPVVGFAYLGSNTVYTDDPPEPGPVPWDETVDDPDGTVTHSLDGEGWYRVGTKLTGERVDHSFEWASVDVRVEEAFTSEELHIEEEWKVAPRV